MYQVHCLNSISPKGTDLLTEDYQRTETIAAAEAILASARDARGDCDFAIEAILREFKQNQSDNG